MKIKISTLLLILIPFSSFSQIKNYLFIGMDRDQLKDTSYFKPQFFDGVQVSYSWRQLEPQKGHYDFSIIYEDLTILKKSGKKLFIALEDASFSMEYNHAPKYILQDTIYHGGANKQYQFKDYHELEYKDMGWVTRRWDLAVQERLYKLFDALGKKFDGVIEGINTEETAVDFFDKPLLQPPGFSFKGYTQAWIDNLMALKKAFPKSIVMVYANFMPGGYMPSQNPSYLRAIYNFAWQNNIGVGGPDLLPYEKKQMTNSYPFIRDSYKKVVSGVAVQDGTFDYTNPATKAKVTAKEIYDFAENYLHLTYIFWGTENPFFKSQTVPLLQAIRLKGE